MIQDQSVVDSILNYENYTKAIAAQQAHRHYLYLQLLDTQMKVLDVAVVKDSSGIPLTPRSLEWSKTLPELNPDKRLRQQFFGYATAFSIGNDYYATQ